MDNQNMVHELEKTIGVSSSMSKRYSSVEFSIRELSYPYQFKLWDMETGSMQIVIKEDSDILDWLKVGNRFDIKYYPEEMSASVNNLETEISHITKADEGKFKGHYIVGLSVTPY